ncbi:uncharacterized protein with SCP/PR1 domains [Longilinea arvoryzae]|uniref:Uncharacterized protein with SCP/PR1 domains n=1 Tax=Longilinea arvoryzae TaxID=360412 RepID=A0A0S7BM06_9CHLR|nr:CAP domain-containing protein [Longilinea arvoryzae]GAP15019.1 uncharacterized protein with SCP/PR1 domains [Longilinea arvoryzae]
MAKKYSLFVIAFFCLQLLSAANLPQTIPTESTDSTAWQPADSNAGFAEPDSTGCTFTTISVQNAAFEQEIIERVNAERAKAGVAPLKSNEALSNASRYQANDMMADDYFNHDTYDRINGTLSLVCGVWTRVSKYYAYDSAAGENIAGGQDTPEQAMNAWMASEGHRANILNPNFRELGVGYYHGGTGLGDFWVQDFGTRSNGYPVVINRESAATNSRSVSVYLYGKGVFNEYRIRDDASQWSNWLPFQEQVNWTLNGSGNLTHIVSVEMRKSSGEVTSASDRIYLAGEATLGNLPESIHFLYIKADHSITPVYSSLQPLNTGTADVLSWTLSASGGWIRLSATSGKTPNTIIEVAPENLGGLAVGTYQGSLTFTITSPASISGTLYTVPVDLTVVDDLPFKVFLPSVLR